MLEKSVLSELQIFVETHLNDALFESLKVENIYELYSEFEMIELDDFVKNNQKPTLAQVLFSLIDKKGESDTVIYKKAGIDRRHFSKIRSNPNYHPRKNTVISLALALELNNNETDDLLNSAGYSLSDSDIGDLVIQFCLKKKIYNIDLVNQALEQYELKPLGGC